MSVSRKVLATLGLAACLALPAVASARDANSDDIECVAIALKMTGMSDPEVAQAGALTAFYFAGRIEGRDPKIDIMGLATAALERMTPAQTQAAANRCGKQLEAKGAEWTARGKELEAQGK